MSTGNPSKSLVEDRSREHVGLIAAMARGDKTALAALYDQLAGPLYSLASSMLGDAAEAQDIVHEIFLQLWRSADTYQVNRGNVFSWTATLAHNRAIDRIRLRQGRSEQAAPAAFADLSDTSAAQLALAAPQLAPPAGLKSRILDAVSTPPSAPMIDFPLLRFMPWAVAAAFALTATWMACQNFSLRTENDSLLIERRLADVAYRTAQGQLAERSLLAEAMINDLGTRLRRSEHLARLKVSVLTPLAGSIKEAQAIVVWDPDQQTGLLTLDMLPAAAAGQDYQIWIVDPAYPNPINGGIFHIAADGQATLIFKPDLQVRQATAFAISLERKGGVSKAEGPTVLLGKVPGT